MIKTIRQLLLLLCLAPMLAQAIDGQSIMQAARARIGTTLYYNAEYVSLDYPKGDVANDRGACTDVVIRTLRTLGLDLQQAIHDDMRANFHLYPTKWGLSKPDRNIDHRRVLNQMRYFERQGKSQPITDNSEDYLPGDIVAWDLGHGLTHIGVITDYIGKRSGRPFVVHNIGDGTHEEDLLFSFKIIGHYRF